MVERLLCKQDVWGSTPHVSTSAAISPRILAIFTARRPKADGFGFRSLRLHRRSLPPKPGFSRVRAERWLGMAGFGRRRFAGRLSRRAGRSCGHRVVVSGDAVLAAGGEGDGSRRRWHRVLEVGSHRVVVAATVGVWSTEGEDARRFVCPFVYPWIGSGWGVPQYFDLHTGQVVVWGWRISPQVGQPSRPSVGGSGGRRFRFSPKPPARWNCRISLAMTETARMPARTIPAKAIQFMIGPWVDCR